MEFKKCFSKEWKSISNAAMEPEKPSPCFDCNICLDFAQEPVVTLCGHLYCWPCIYKWFHFQTSSLPSDELPQCPVCKSKISQTTVVPLYGGGKTEIEDGKKPNYGMIIPPRPPASPTQFHQPIPPPPTTHHPHHYNPHSNPHNLPPLFNVGDSHSHPLVGMFGEMVYARVFGNSESLYTYPNSYHLEGSRSPRLRRQEMEANKCLNRISIFLFCCFLLCLMLF